MDGWRYGEGKGDRAQNPHIPIVKVLKYMGHTYDVITFSSTCQCMHSLLHNILVTFLRSFVAWLLYLYRNTSYITQVTHVLSGHCSATFMQTSPILFH